MVSDAELLKHHKMNARYSLFYSYKNQMDDPPAATTSTTHTPSSAGITEEPFWVMIFSACVIGVIMVLGLVLNLVLLVVFAIKRQLRTQKNILLLNQVFSNIMACFAVLLPMFINNLNKKPYTGQLCEFIGIVSQIWWFGHVFTLMLLSYDRYVFITRAINYTVIVTHDKIYIACMMSWVTAFALALCPIFTKPKYVFHTELYTCGVMSEGENTILTTVLSVAYFWIPFSLMILCYVQIVRHARRNEINTTTNRRRMCQNSLFFGAIKTSLVILGTVSIAWIPQLILMYLRSFHATNIASTVQKLVNLWKYLPIVIFPWTLGMGDRTIRMQLRKLYHNLHAIRNANKIQPSPTIEEADYSENVSRRNSRSELPTSSQLSRKNSFIDKLRDHVTRKNSSSTSSGEFFMEPGSTFHLDTSRRESNESGLTNVYIN